MSIPRLNADISLVDFNGSEHVPVLAAGRRGTDKVTKLPGGFLRGPKVARQLDAGNPIQTGEHKIHDGDRDPAAQWRVMHHRACFHGKVAPAVMARIRLGPTFHAFRNMCRVAMCATTNQPSRRFRRARTRPETVRVSCLLEGVLRRANEQLTVV